MIGRRHLLRLSVSVPSALRGRTPPATGKHGDLLLCHLPRPDDARLREVRPVNVPKAISDATEFATVGARRARRVDRRGRDGSDAASPTAASADRSNGAPQGVGGAEASRRTAVQAAACARCGEHMSGPHVCDRTVASFSPRDSKACPVCCVVSYRAEVAR